MTKHPMARATLAAWMAGAVPVAAPCATAARAVPSDPHSASGRIGRVQVTAARTGTVDVQRVPAAVTIVKPDGLPKYGLDDIAGLVPAMTAQQQATGVNDSTMRGLAVRRIAVGSAGCAAGRSLHRQDARHADVRQSGPHGAGPAREGARLTRRAGRFALPGIG